MKQKVVKGLLWKLLENGGAQGVQFVIAIILARLLTPAQYGVVGIITIFITIANVVVQSGFSTALVQKQKADKVDFSSVCYFDLFVALVMYGILYAVNGYPSLMGTAFSTYYISLSIFLGFAISFPDMQVLLYFIIPIKIKWLAYLDVALLAYSMITSIMSGNWAGCVVILCSLANVLVFFLMTRKGKRGSFQQNRRRKEFKKAVSRGEAEYRNPNGITKHKCAICGRTEKDDPNLEFRFCSRCNGNYEYCQDHLFTHEHVK